MSLRFEKYKRINLIVMYVIVVLCIAYFTRSWIKNDFNRHFLSVHTKLRYMGSSVMSGSNSRQRFLRITDKNKNQNSNRISLNSAYLETPADHKIIPEGINKQQNHHQPNKENRVKSREDLYCLTTLQGKINKDDENNWIIPERDELLLLPQDVLDCLYYRYTTSLQKLCAKRSRHGSILNGWNLCEDGCYSPLENTTIHVISLTQDYTSDMSLKNMHHSKVQRYTPKFPKDSQKDLKFIPMRKEGKINQTILKETNLTYEVMSSKNVDNVLIIDAGSLTTLTIDHVIRSGILNQVQQLSIRTNYIRPFRTEIDQITALDQLRNLYNLGFRIYWSRMEEQCMVDGDDHRTGCVYIDMVYKRCRDEHRTEEQKHLVIPKSFSEAFTDQNKLIDFYFNYLSSTQTLCKEVVRLGGIKDGGWNVCNDEKYRPKIPCLVYSFGISWDFNFDDAVAAAYGCEVHSFDPSMKSADFRRNKQIWFHNIGLLDKLDFWDKNLNWNFSTLTGLRKHLNHNSRNLDILKIDIESSEWRALPEMIKSGSIRDVKQLYLEFHSTGTPEHLAILKLLYDDGFRIFWYHRNYHCSFKRRFVQVTKCNEVYFLRE